MNEFFGLLGSGFKEFNEWEIHWGPENPGLIFALTAVLVPLALWFSWKGLARVQSLSKKIFLIGLRVFVFVLLLLVLLRPTLEFSKSHSLRNSIAVLLDDSKSLSIKTFPSEKSRIEWALETLDRNKAYFGSLRENFNVDFYLASDRLQSIPESEIPKRYRPKGPVTNFTRVLKQLEKQYEDKPLQGMMLFSDGADLTEEAGEISRELVDALAAFNGPVHTLQAGTNDQFKDLAIEDLEGADFGFVHQPLQLTVTVRASFMGARNVPLVLKEGEKVLVSKVLEIRESETLYSVDIQFVPKTVGKRVYTLSLPLFAGESITSNNKKEFQIKVVRDRIRILHLNGRPSWDSRFLREVLVKNPKVDLLSFFILRTLEDDVEAPTTELSLIPFPSNLLFSDYLSSFDLIIFQNFRYEPFVDKKFLPNIKNYVEQGGAFLMIGGDLSFQAGGFHRTAVEEILPVRFKMNSRNFLDKDFQLRAVEKFLNHPILRLEKDPAANREIWKTLPRLHGLNSGLTPRAGAQVLAGFSEAPEKPMTHPVLVVGQKGEGRSAALATDSSWNWDFRRVGEGGSGRYYQKFWNNLIGWLTRDEESRLLHLETDKDLYRENETALIKIKAYREDFTPAAGEKVSLTLKPLGGQTLKQDLVTDEKGDAGYEYPLGLEGFYRAAASVERGGKKISEETVFGVSSETAEFLKPLVNEWLMKKMAEISGGKYQVLHEKTDLAGLRFANPEVHAQSRTKTLSLWDHWWSYGFILGFLLIDWYTRRKSGLS